MLLDELARPAGLARQHGAADRRAPAQSHRSPGSERELERSNSRIVQARRDEIDRLRGEMHQRVSPHIDRADAMVHDEITVLTADVADGGPPPGEGASRSDAGRLDVALTEVAEALESLRTLARGIYPPRLADAGLEVSLEGWQQRSGVAVDFRLIGDDAALRRHSDIESCLYFSLVTVLAALSGESGHPAVVVEVSPGYVDAVISGLHDGGGGGDDDDAGAVHAAALRAVRDRVEAFDGQLTIEAPPQADSVDRPAAAAAVRRSRTLPRRRRRLPRDPAGGARRGQLPGPGGSPRACSPAATVDRGGRQLRGSRRGAGGDRRPAAGRGAHRHPDAAGPAGRGHPHRRALPATAPDDGCRAAEPVRRGQLRPDAARRGHPGPRLPAEGTGRRSGRAASRAVDAVAGGGSAIDPKVVETLVSGRSLAGDQSSGPADAHGNGRCWPASPRAAPMPAIAAELFLTQHAVEKHINAIFTKLGLSGDRTNHPRVRATLMYLAEGRR